MEKSQFEKEVKELIHTDFGVTAEVEILNTDSLEDLGFDSLDVVELVMNIEAKYGAKMPDSIYDFITTESNIGELIDVCYKEITE